MLKKEVGRDSWKGPDQEVFPGTRSQYDRSSFGRNGQPGAGLDADLHAGGSRLKLHPLQSSHRPG